MSRKQEYQQVYDGDGIVMPDGTLWLMCCDCALVHFVKIKVAGKRKVVAYFLRDDRATAAARRGKRFRRMKLPPR